MTAGFALLFLLGFAVLGAAARLVIDLARHGGDAEPANSSPGRVVPPGTPVMRAIREGARLSHAEMAVAIENLSAAGAPPIEKGGWVRFDGTSYGEVTGGGPDGDLLVAVAWRESPVRVPPWAATPLPFRPGQWVRHKVIGRLAEYMSPSASPGACWVGLAGGPLIFDREADYGAALPRPGERWSKRFCRAHEGAPCAGPVLLTTGHVWHLAPARLSETRCGCLAPSRDPGGE
jgi:hypothetical protein